MKGKHVVFLIGTVLVSGCTSYVRVYDADNKPIRSCMVKTTLFGRGAVSCLVPNLIEGVKPK